MEWAMHKFPEGNLEEARCPHAHVEQSGLYVLITEAEFAWMPKELIDDPIACIQYLQKMLEDGTLRVKIGSAFGKWYLYGNLVCNCYIIFIILHCQVLGRVNRPLHFTIHCHAMPFVCCLLLAPII